ncbi:hypothetical protein FPQ18DRAFT_307191 [Pyronema domesticum]|uniref:Uncharacterized protein n=1 Tax=Pyronema omphalodes (strain CBS 100304) TaxID=1076935 RepID=U4LT82_PYROM|nr:hypothetical protein FPQ18DRAFT_307191 [Pyronema domesticum]CCX30626.1 Protein of unknown function [Pyronema omphalodes CBS 100304]
MTGCPKSARDKRAARRNGGGCQVQPSLTGLTPVCGTVGVNKVYHPPETPISEDFETEEELHEYLYQRGMDPATKISAMQNRTHPLAKKYAQWTKGGVSTLTQRIFIAEEKAQWEMFQQKMLDQLRREGSTSGKNVKQE